MLSMGKLRVRVGFAVVDARVEWDDILEVAVRIVHYDCVRVETGRVDSLTGIGASLGD